MLAELKERVWRTNLALPQHGLVKFTWGNVSAIDRERGLVVIKPSGVDYEVLTPDDMVVTDLTGTVVEGTLNPSSDLRTHLALYRAFDSVGGVVHTHSNEAVAWAQAGRDIPFYGTTHADYFYGPIPCARSLTPDEINGDYEAETGTVIIETFHERNLDPVAVPGIVVRNHGPFTWGKTPEEAVYHSVVLEEVALMAKNTELLNPKVNPAPQVLLDKHYLRKHGANAYYGQKGAAH